MTHEVTVDLAGGKRISFETGKLARQAHGAVVVRMGDNVVLATATANPDPREGIDFFPLTVDYREDRGWRWQWQGRRYRPCVLQPRHEPAWPTFRFQMRFFYRRLDQQLLHAS